MTNYTPVNPEYSGTLLVLESSDAVSAAITNRPLKQLMDNDAAIKASVDLLMENGTKLADVVGATISTSMQTITLKWTDPSDVTLSGAVIAKWKGTKLVRKAGSAPTDVNDGDVILDNQARDAYSSSGYVDTGLTYGTTHYYRFFPYTEMGAVTKGTALSATPARELLAYPSASGTYTYDGTLQNVAISDFDATKEDVTGGDTSGTNAGTYTFYVTPKSDYTWADNTRDPYPVTWEIEKAAGSATLSKNTATLDADNLTDTVTVTAATGTVSGASSSDTSIATVSVSGNDITVSHVNKATGTATVTVNIAASANYNATSVTFEVEATFTTVYGAEWDGTSTTAWSRTDAAAGFVDPVPAVNNGNGSSPFDNLMPWAGMEIVDDATAGKLVKIPKYWYKWTRNGSRMKLQIADGEQDGFLVSPAHADRGDGAGERDYVYVGRYHCATSTYKSTTGVKPANNYTRANFRSYIHNLGTDIWQYDFAMYWTIMMLYLVEFADWNSQAKIGYGCGNNSAAENAGLTDAMQYHTGTNAANRTTYGHTQYRHIEDLWGNVYDWCDGIYFSGSSVYCIKNPADFSDGSGGTMVGTRSTSSNYISAWTAPSANGFEYALYPSAVNGSESTYVCDYCVYHGSGVVLYVGGDYIQYQGYGAFYLVGDHAASNKSSNVGSRLQKLPSAA